MKKWSAMIMAVLLLAALLAGCKPSEESLLVGKWKAKVDLALAYEDLLARADATVAAHVDLRQFEVELTAQFKSDGTYRLRVDENQLRTGAVNMDAAIRQGMAAYLQAQTGKTMDNLLTAAGLTMDEVMEKYFADDLTAVIRENLESEGTYKVSGGKLILTDEDGSKFFEGKCDVEEEELVLKSGVTRAVISSLLPLTLEKK